MLFEAQLSPDNTEMKITIAGRFDFNLHSEFRNSYKNLPPTTKYIIDLEKTDYIDSSAMGMLLLLREHAGSDGNNVVLKNCSDDIKNLLHISNLDKIFVIE